MPKKIRKNSPVDVLVVGAGPVGLAHAIECKRWGLSVRIIDKNKHAGTQSKAVGIHARTLDLLEAAEVTPALLKAGIQVKKMTFWDQHVQPLTVLEFDRLPHPYAFVLSLPQNETEAIFEKRLKQMGVIVERETEFLSFVETNAVIEAECIHKGKKQTISARNLVGADGAHSRVRELLELSFQGFRYDDDWSLIDANLEVPNDWNDANLFMCGQNGMLFLVRIGKDRYRAIANRSNVQALLPSSIRVKKILWESEFHVSCRQVDRYQKGRVFVMGDAAHIHSPAGGRGMNMGIEDACVLARLLSVGDAERYTEMRHKPGHETIVLTNRLFRMASIQNPLLVALRNFFIKHVVSRPGFQRRMIVKMSGLEQQWQC